MIKKGVCEHEGEEPTPQKEAGDKGKCCRKEIKTKCGEDLLSKMADSTSESTKEKDKHV